MSAATHSTRESAEIVVEVSGRANLIGDHTDYQDGLALPFALDGLTLRLEGRVGGDAVVLASGLDGCTHRVEVNAAGAAGVDARAIGADVATVAGAARAPDAGSSPRAASGAGWGRYADAVVRALRDAGHPLRPLAATISSTLPAGAGLGSSAALELAVALAVCDEPLSPLELARVCQRAESVYVGVPCGMLDQLAIVAGRADHALSLDCRDLTLEQIPWPDGLAVAVVHSGGSRGLGAGSYAARRRETERAAERLGVATLRELAPGDLDAALRDLPDPLGRRTRHVVSENARVEAVAAALRGGDHRTLAMTLAASHRSLAEDFEVSTPELDVLVEFLRAVPGSRGARMTGGGFGGCAVALFESPLDAAALERALGDYERRTGRAPRRWVTRPGIGIRRGWP